MARNPKCFIHGALLELGFRTEEGLPFVAAPYMQLILLSVLARAQELFYVTICHGILMGNHSHLLIVVENPEMVDDFVGYVKRESAHAINRLLGRRRHTVWCQGYDSAVILDPQKAIDRIGYLYTNPQRANLVEKIEDYPNLSTWNVFKSGAREIHVPRIPRDIIPSLPRASISLVEQQRLADDLRDQGRGGNILFIDPDAWMRCFPELEDTNPKQINTDIERCVLNEQERLSRKRLGDVLGVHNLRLARIDQRHSPKKHGRKMICLSTFRHLRVRFIEWFKERCEEAHELYRRWKEEAQPLRAPPGMFAPGGIMSANLNPVSTPLY